MVQKAVGSSPISRPIINFGFLWIDRRDNKLMNLAVVGIVFGIIFISELPDKSMFTSLILSTRYPRRYVWLGAAGAFLAHVIIAVALGSVLILLPHKIVAVVVAGLFFLGAVILLSGKHGFGLDSSFDKAKITKTPSAWKIIAISFGLIFIGEWGDITQIATANYAARYQNPLSVAIGAVLALWITAAIAVLIGPKLARHLPLTLLSRTAATGLLVFGVLSLYSAIN